MKPTRIMAIGEVLWDVFPDGAKFGGAPANFACAVAELCPGDEVVSEIVSAVGRDELGTRALAILREHGVDASRVAVNDFPTGRVDVTLDTEGKASYVFAIDSAWDHLEWYGELAQAAKRADVICFGTLGQRAQQSREIIRRVLSSAGPDCLKILDINLRTPFWDEEVLRESLALANVIKLNDEELPIVASVLGINGTESELPFRLMERYSPRLLALTRGSNGSLLINNQGQKSEMPGIQVEIADTVGAGDSFTAVLALGLCRGWALEQINRKAIDVAAYVCTQPGGAPRLPASFWF